MSKKNKPKISVVIPVYKPEEEVLKKIKEMLKKQTIEAEVIENWDMPEAQSTNTGIRKAKREIIVTLSQDCLPSDEKWLEKLTQPLIEDKNVVAVVSDLILPEWYWKKYPFLIRLLTIPDKRVRKPDMDVRGCAFRRKDLEKAGLFNEDPKVIAIEMDLYLNLRKMGKIVRSNTKIYHLHKYPNFRKIVTTLYDYSKSNGKVVKMYGTDNGAFWQRVIRALPFFGFASILYRYPIETHLKWLPLYLITAGAVNHVVNVFGFWEGFFFDKESKRNTEVLEEQKKD